MPLANRILTIVAAALLAPLAAGALPGEINYQGRLSNAGGIPLSGAVDLDFALYDAEASGTPLWTESHDDVEILGGVYQVVLGGQSPLTPALVASGAVWLEITVEGETLAPRQRLLSAPFALRAGDAAAADGTPTDFLAQVYAHVSYDGSDPPNDDPREGVGDPDGDGLANFIDPDNDDDGLSDADELAGGSDLNLVTPQIGAVAPTLARNDQAQTIGVSGAAFQAGLSVVVGSQSPAPSSLTPTSFDVQVGPQPSGPVDVTVTNPNGETATLANGLEFVPAAPIVLSTDPPSLRSCLTTTVSLDGLFFDPGLTVAFGSESPAPQNQTATHLEVEIGPQPPGTVDVDLTNPNQLTGSSSFEFTENVPIVTGFSPPEIMFDETATVTVLGQNFDPGVSVVFGAETPTPTNVTSTSFDVTVGPQPGGPATVTVTNECGEQASDSFVFVELKRVFKTSLSYSANLGGLAGADAKCAELAANAGLPGTFLAWLSDGVDSPDTRFSRAGRYYVDRDGPSDQVIADDWEDLTDGNLQFSISYDETGQSVLGFTFTNVAADGTAFHPVNHCSGWTDTSGSFVGGRAATDSTWTNWTVVPGTCAGTSRLYCFEQ